MIPRIKEYFLGRKILICREISKYYEEYIRTDIDKLKLFDNKLKGELTVVISEKKDEKNSIRNASFPALSLSVKNPVSSKILILLVTLQILSNAGILYFLYLGME